MKSSLLFLSIAIYFVVILFFSLNLDITLDETGTFWVLDSGFFEIFYKTETTFKLPLYYQFLWLWGKIFGHSLELLRIFSILFIFFTLFFTYKLGKELFDKKTGILGEVFLAINSSFVVHNTLARPYSFALFFCVFSLWCFFKYLKSKEIKHLNLFLFSVVIPPLCNFYFVLIWPSFLLLFFLYREEIKIPNRNFSFLGSSIFGIFSIIYLILEYLKLNSLKNSDIFYFESNLSIVLESILPISIVCPLVIAGLFNYFDKNRISFKSKPILSLLIFYFCPLLILLFLSISKGQLVFLDKYLIYQLPVGALIIALLIKNLEIKKQALIILLTMIVTFFSIKAKLDTMMYSAPNIENLITSIDRDCSVSANSLFYESSNKEFFLDPIHQDFFGSFFKYYWKSNHKILPRTITKENEKIFMDWIDMLSENDCNILFTFDYNYDLRTKETKMIAESLYKEANNRGIKNLKIIQAF